MLDMGLSALIKDLDNRDMLDDVSVVVWGEFGRSPRINNNAGRDHWPQAAGALLAGGGMKTGQVVGSTDRLGGQPEDCPVDYHEIFATLYNQVGINSESLIMDDRDSRPHQLVNGCSPIGELI